MSGDYHEISDFIVQQMGQAFMLGICSCSLDMDLVYADASDVHISKERNLSAWTASTASTVQATHARLQTHYQGKEMVVARHGGVNRFLGLREGTEVEAWAPAEL